MTDLLKMDFEKLKTILNDPIKRKNSLNFSDFDGKVSLEELSEIRELINNDTTLKPHLGGSSYCGN